MTQMRATADDRQASRTNSATIRLGAVAMPLGIVTTLVATALHPHREDVMDDPAVFAEYARTSSWIADHFAQWVGAMLLLGGLIGLHLALKRTSGLSVGLARFGAVAAVQAAAAVTALQAVDGIALKWAVDAWVAAPAADKTGLFAAAEALRWTEYAFQSFSNILLGLTLVFYGLAIVLGGFRPRWLGWPAVASGVAWIIHAVMVSYVGLFDSTPRLIAMILLGVWAFATAVPMWRDAGRPTGRSSYDREVAPATVA